MLVLFLKRIDKSKCFIILCLFLVALWYSFSTRFHPYANGSYGHDAGIFAYIGFAMKEGRILYTEAWENKGPLLYFINMLGVSLNYWHGIYILELITLFTTLVFLFKTSNLFFNKWVSLIAAVFSSIPLCVTLEGGNLSEEYALPFMAWSLYLSAKFFKQDCNLKFLDLFFVGVSISAVFLLRLNILAFQFCLVLAVIVILIKRKEFLRLLKVFIFAFTGFVVFTIPFLIYLIKNNALKDCLDTAYFGVVSSFETLGNVARLTNVINMIEEFIRTGSFYIIIVFIFVLPIICIKKIGDLQSEKKVMPILWACYGAFFVNLLANSISGVKHMHYFMTFIPIILFPAAWMFNKMYILFKNRLFSVLAYKRQLSVCVTALIVFFISLNSITTLSDIVLNNLPSDTKTNYSRLNEYIVNNSDAGETIQTFGGHTAVTAYYRSQRLAASKYSYYANGLFSDESKYIFANKIANDVYESKPRLIIADYASKYNDFIAHLDYAEKWEQMIDEEYTAIENDFGCIVFKRK